MLSGKTGAARGILCAAPLLVVLLLAGAAHAQAIQRVDVVADISADNSVTEAIKYYFGTPLPAGDVNYTLTEKVRNIVVFGDDQKLSYVLTGTNMDTLQISLQGPTSTCYVIHLSNLEI
jgi:hypothetical protein